MTGESAPRLRSARAADLDAVMDMESRVFASDAWSRDSMAAEFASPHTVYLVATSADDDARILGYAGLLALRGAPDADVQTIAVVEEARGTGLGRALLTTLLEEARSRGAREVLLEVRSDNPVAQNLYLSLGFEEIGVRPGYYQPDGVDALVLRLVLPAPVSVPPARQEESS